MPGVAGPASHKSKWKLAHVSHSVRGIRRNKMQAPTGHRFHARLATLIHQDERTLAVNGSVVFGAIALQVKVPVRHEVFGADLTRFDYRGPPELSTFRSFGDWTPRLHAINGRVRIHLEPCVLIGEDTLQLPVRLLGFAHLRISNR